MTRTRIRWNLGCETRSGRFSAVLDTCGRIGGDGYVCSVSWLGVLVVCEVIS
jgi:hypothetical protein